MIGELTRSDPEVSPRLHTALDPVVRVRIRGPKLTVRCPFDQRFIDGAKALGGFFMPRERLWRFGVDHEQAVHMLCHSVFGAASFDLGTLRQERSRLTARIEEIDQLLRGAT